MIDFALTLNFYAWLRVFFRDSTEMNDLGLTTDNLSFFVATALSYLMQMPMTLLKENI